VSIKVVIVDDQELVRAGFRVLLESEDEIEVLGEAATGEEAVTLVRETEPDVALMDIRMPGMDGLEATERIFADGDAKVRILILTTFDLDEYVHRALRAGASGFLLKDTSPKDLLEAIRIVAGGEALLSPSITRRLIEEFVERPDHPKGPIPELGLLTAREQEVLALVGRGMSNAEIAEHLVVSPATSKTHVSRVMTKLAARDRAQLVVIAYESGLVRPGDR
jgi:DNA-binding NarL/FixJ family response regulator